MKSFVIALALVGLAACASKGASISFWPTKITPPAYVEVSGHPCGEILTIQSNVIPEGEAWLEPDVIHEIDGDGQILRTWRVPIDQYPVGLEGDSVVLAYGSEPTTVMKVSLAGRIKVVPSSRLPELEGVECPAPLNKDFFCVVVGANPRRLLTYSPVCT